MLRFATLLLLLLLMTGASAGARDYRRSRREPSSAAPPPVNYPAIRKKVVAEVRPRVEAWLSARTRILAACERCRGFGVLPDPLGECPSCPFAEGVVVHPELDLEVVNRDVPYGRAALRDVLRTRPFKLNGIAIRSGEIDEIRVLGSGQALVFVRTRTFGRSGGVWHPEVSLWIRSGGEWRARGPFSGSPPRDYAGGGRFPPSELAQPKHEAGTRESLLEMARALSPGRSRKDGRVDFIVRGRAPGTRLPAVFHAKGRLGGEIEVRQRRLPLREEMCGDVDLQQRLLQTLFEDLLGKGMLPDPAEFHLTHNGPVLLATGFSPERYLEEVAIVADPEGRPASITRTRSGRSLRMNLRYVEDTGPRLSGWTRQSAAGRERVEIRWRVRGGWLPYRVKVERPEGVYEFTCTPE